MAEASYSAIFYIFLRMIGVSSSQEGNMQNLNRLQN